MLKVRAAQERVTIESLCVRFLWWGLDGCGSSVVERRSEKPEVAGSIPAPSTKCAGAEVANGAGYAGCEPEGAPETLSMRKHSPASSILAPHTNLGIVTGPDITERTIEKDEYSQ